MSNIEVPEQLIVFNVKASSTETTLTCFDEKYAQQSHNDLSEDTSLKVEQKVGRWDYDEQVLYLEFISNNKQHLQSKECRRSNKVFKMMALAIKCRSSEQCRSHHQKMTKKYKLIESILVNCKKRLHRLKKRKTVALEKNISKQYQKQQPKIFYQQFPVQTSQNQIKQSVIIQDIFETNSSIQLSDIGFDFFFRKNEADFSMDLLDFNGEPLF